MRRVVLALAVVACGAACGGNQKPQDDLLYNVRGYQEGLRWRRYEDSASRLAPSKREAFLDKRDELDDELRVDDYEIMRVKMQAQGKKATVQVKLTWHLDSVGIVKDTVVEESWERHKTGWFLVGEKLKRGPEMPGVPPGKAGEQGANGGDPPANRAENDSGSEGLGR